MIMTPPHLILVLILFLSNLTVDGWPTPPTPPRPDPTGHFVPFDQISTCPVLTPRPPPRSARDVRPDDIKVVMAIGDSITAGFLAKPPDAPSSNSVKSSKPSKSSKSPTWPNLPWPELQLPQLPFMSRQRLSGSFFSSSLPIAREYRGVSYPIGGDPSAITLPNILTHWSGNLTGPSRGYHSLTMCVGSWCLGGGGRGGMKEDGLNAAVSGSTSDKLWSQVNDNLLPKIKKMGLERDVWKFLNIGIGANDICAFCLSPNGTGLPLLGTPQEFARGIKDAVNLLRKHVLGLFRVSSIYKLTLKDPYCRGPFLPVLPHLPLECSCALLPGPAGDYTRAKMDELGEMYDEAVLDMIRDWEDEDDRSFGATWQPGTMVVLEHWPIEALSPVDCFHPSELAHRRMAGGVWNRLTVGLEEKAVPIRWEEDVYVRCLEEDDRIQLGFGGAR